MATGRNAILNSKTSLEKIQTLTIEKRRPGRWAVPPMATGRNEFRILAQKGHVLSAGQFGVQKTAQNFRIAGVNLEKRSRVWSRNRKEPRAGPGIGGGGGEREGRGGRKLS